MKNVLFISISEYNNLELNPHLGKKFEGLKNGMNVFVIGRGRPFHKRIWGCNFYLIAPRIFYVPAAITLGIYLCFFKKIDTIVCQGPLTEGLIGLVLKRIFRKELIIEIHGDWKEGPFLNKKRSFEFLLRPLVPRLGTLILRNADKIRTLTERAKCAVEIAFPGKKYFAFPTFTDIDIFLEERDRSFKTYVLSVAILSPIKGIDILIDAFYKIHAKFPQWTLVIAGSGPCEQDLADQAEKLDIINKVVFTGAVSLDGVKDLMKHCSVFVLPSLSEAFGRVFIEAMALGKPVVGTAVGGIPELIRDGENGFLVVPKNSGELSERLCRLLGDSGLCRAMGERGFRFVKEHFSNEIYIDHYIEMIQK